MSRTKGAKNKEKKSKWTVGDSRCYADINNPTQQPEIKALVKAKAEELVADTIEEHAALIHKRANERIENISNQMLQDILNNKNIDTHQRIMELALRKGEMIERLCYGMIENEYNKKNPSIKIIQWAISELNNSRKIDSELRKGNKEQFEMKHGKRSVKINVDKQSIDDWLNGKKSEAIEVEGVEIAKTEQGKDKATDK